MRRELRDVNNEGCTHDCTEAIICLPNRQEILSFRGDYRSRADRSSSHQSHLLSAASAVNRASRLSHRQYHHDSCDSQWFKIQLDVEHHLGSTSRSVSYIQKHFIFIARQSHRSSFIGLQQLCAGAHRLVSSSFALNITVHADTAPDCIQTVFWQWLSSIDACQVAGFFTRVASLEPLKQAQRPSPRGPTRWVNIIYLLRVVNVIMCASPNGMRALKCASTKLYFVYFYYVLIDSNALPSKKLVLIIFWMFSTSSTSNFLELKRLEPIR